MNKYNTESQYRQSASQIFLLLCSQVFALLQAFGSSGNAALLAAYRPYLLSHRPTPSSKVQKLGRLRGLEPPKFTEFQFDSKCQLMLPLQGRNTSRPVPSQVIQPRCRSSSGPAAADRPFSALNTKHSKAFHSSLVSTLALLLTP